VICGTPAASAPPANPKTQLDTEAVALGSFCNRVHLLKSYTVASFRSRDSEALLDEPSDSRSFASFALRCACKRSNSRIASNSWRFIAVW
jgi:hypothetical protein